MLFILVIDVVNNLSVKADSEGLLSPLIANGQRLSLYVDYVSLFIRSNGEDLQLTKSLLQIFGEAVGLETNWQKSCVILIQCGEDVGELVNNTLQCMTSIFPSTYLGLPISNNKLRRGDLLAWVEKIAQVGKPLF